MVFDPLDRPAQARLAQQRLRLALGCGALLIIGVVALAITIRRLDDIQPTSPEPHSVTEVAPKTLHAEVPNPLVDVPRDRPPPEHVNEFLRQEQARNASRCDILRSTHQIDITTEFRSHCRPEWDFRDPRREVIWFYHYTSGHFDGLPLTVFGAVDGMGKPLLQHPPMAGDPLALLDSQYQAVKWIALDTPRVALIAAANAPSADSDQIVDLFLINDVAPGTPRSWRFGGDYYPEQPDCSFQLICFQDANGDGLRDVCTLHFLGGDEPTTAFHPFLPEAQSFATTPSPGSHHLDARMCAILREIESPDPQFTEPYVVRASPLEPVFTSEPEPSETQAPQES